MWIVDEITASTLVLGTETTSTLEFRLPYLEIDECYLPDSPFGLGTLTFSISASAGANGQIWPAGIVYVDYGDSQTFRITPNLNYTLSLVLVDGEPALDLVIPAGGSFYYTFPDVTEDHEIFVDFELEP